MAARRADADVALYGIDAAKHFGAAVDACLLLFTTGAAGPSEAGVFSDLKASAPATQLGLAGKELVADLKAYRELRHLEGLCPFQWRSGVKHDCAPVMELTPAAEGRWANGLGESVELETRFVFPLLKCSDLANGRLAPRRAVIVPQRYVGDDTSEIARLAPLTWSYLQSHAERFRGRKSSIYKAAMPFALFGIGNYSFSPWKVAVSALHRSARFHAIGPHQSQPVFFDDTCYLLPFAEESDARFVAELLHSEPCQHLLNALVFTDSKRPITVDLLQRIDLAAVAAACGRGREWREIQQRRNAEPAENRQLTLIMESPLALRG